MLAPDRRELLLDALRPPAGHSLDRAVATTFTLDLEAALTVPLAFAGFRFDEQPDPIEIMEALREMGRRIDIFCQAGAIGAGSWPSDLLALLEGSIHAARRPRPGHIFHPKVWALRFLDRAQEPSYRLLVLSRNLTRDRSWDTVHADQRAIAGRSFPAAAAEPGLGVHPFRARSVRRAGDASGRGSASACGRARRASRANAPDARAAGRRDRGCPAHRSAGTEHRPRGPGPGALTRPLSACRPSSTTARAAGRPSTRTGCGRSPGAPRRGASASRLPASRRARARRCPHLPTSAPR